MIERVSCGSAAARLAAAEAFLDGLPSDGEALLVGASRGAIDELARRVAVRRRATCGLHRFTLTQLAARLAAPALSATGAAPCPPLAAQAVAARALAEARAAGALRFFAPVAGAPGFTGALAATLAELRAAGVAPAGLAGAPPPADELAALLAAYETHLAGARLADRAALLGAATAAVAAPDRDPLLGLPLLLLDVPLTSRVEVDFARALAGAAARTLVTLPAGDEAERQWPAAAHEADTPPDTDTATSLGRLQAFLFADAEPPPGEADDSVQLFSAPGEGREAVEIARRILAAARAGTRFDEIAIALRSPETYGTLLEAALRRAGIPAWFARGTRRPNPGGRAFLALLACAAEGLSAARFAEYLSLGEAPRPDAAPTWQPPRDEAFTAAAAAPAATDEADAPEDGGEPVAAAPWRWEALLTEAAVLGGADRWARRLDGLAREYDERLARLRDEEPDAPRLAALARTRAQLDVLRTFALPLIGRLAALPAQASWGEWLTALAALATQALRAPAGVQAVLAELAPMATVGPVGLDEVRAVLADRLATLTADPPAERHGRVLVTTIDDLRGRALPLVFVPGLAERLFPQRPREDPLLLDALRTALDAALDTQAERGARERLRLRLAAGAATHRLVLSYPRADVIQGRPRVISFYGLDVARATRGAIPDVEAFERAAADAATARLAWPAPLDPADAIDTAEHDLATLAGLLRADDPAARRAGAQYLLELNPHLGRSLRARHARWEKHRWHELDGFTRAGDAAAAALAGQRLTARPYSPSALEQFARCPYRFFLAAILRLAPRAAPAPLEQLDPLTRGTLVHRVQAETLRALLADGTPLTEARLPDAERVLEGTLERIAAAFAEDFAPPIERVWRDEVEAVRGDLRTWLQRLLAHGAEWQPVYVELGIGLDARREYDPASVRAPARIGDAGYRLRGAIDLVERRADGALRVIDHKTGRDDVPSGLVVGHGERLQPALYALAVEAALGAPVHDARLSFCTTRGGFTEHVVRFDATTRATALEVLTIIDRAIAGGHFHAAPRADACGTCDFRPVCGPYEEERAARKAPIADLAALRSRR